MKRKIRKNLKIDFLKELNLVKNLTEQKISAPGSIAQWFRAYGC